MNGSWSNGAKGTGSCVTDANGMCDVAKTNLKPTTASVTFTVTGVSASGSTYTSGDNHDPDGDSTGTVIVVSAP